MYGVHVKLPEGYNIATISYGHGYLEDCYSKTVKSWSEYGSPTLTDTSMAVQNNDYFRVTGTAAATDKYTYFLDSGNSVSTTLYPKYLVRLRTSESSSGLGAKVLLDFVEGGPTLQWIIGGEDTTEGDPEFSTSWKLFSGDITGSRTIQTVRLYATSDAACTAEWVEYDFILFYKGDFTIPNFQGGMLLDLRPRYVYLPVPGKMADSTQNLGGESAEWQFGCDLDQNTWKRTNDDVDGQVFMDIAHNSGSEPWQWFDDGERQLKVTVHPKFHWREIGGNATRSLDVLLREYSLGDKSVETVVERFSLDQ